MALKWEQMTEEEREEYADQDKVKWRNNVKLESEIYREHYDTEGSENHFSLDNIDTDTLADVVLSVPEELHKLSDEYLTNPLQWKCFYEHAIMMKTAPEIAAKMKTVHIYGLEIFAGAVVTDHAVNGHVKRARLKLKERSLTCLKNN